MKSLVPKSKTMRVATALTGMTACAAGFVPTAAQAAPAGGLPGKVPLPAHNGLRVGVRTAAAANSGSRYWLDIIFRASVHSYQVCGYHVNDVRRCTAWTGTTWVSDNKYNEGVHVGGNIASWVWGTVSVRWNGGGAGRWDQCSIPYHETGSLVGGADGYSSRWLYGNISPLIGIGAGIPTC
jgi:hypothetical protein